MLNKNIKKIITIVLLISLLNITNVNEISAKDTLVKECAYKSDFDSCLVENWLDEYWNRTWQLWFPRWIEDYLCISSTDPAEILENIILDKKFKEIEKEMDNYLNTLAINRMYYFQPWSDVTEITWVDDIRHIFSSSQKSWSALWTTFWLFHTKFNDLCKQNWIFEEIMGCMWSIEIINAPKTISDWTWNNECMRLAETKLEIYENIAQNILKMNKWKAIEDNIDKYNKELNKKYNDFFMSFVVNLDYLWTIVNNWVSKTRKCFWW